MEGNESGPATVNAQPRKRLFTRRRLVTLLLILLVCTGICYYFLVYRESKKVGNDQCSTVAQQKTLFKDAHKTFDAPDKKGLNELVIKIKQVPDYRRDQNCIYPIVINDITRGDSTAAQQSYQQFVAVYDKKRQLPSAFGTNTTPVNQLKTIIDGMNSRNQKLQEQMQIFSPRVESDQ